jgi:hypothetical protein
VKNIEQIGKLQYNTFTKERLDTAEKPITDVITRNKLPLFSRHAIPDKSKDKLAAASWKKDSSTMSSLYISGLTREGKPKDFFQYENHPFPVSLSDHGKLSPPGDKAALVECIEKSVALMPVINAPAVDSKIFDGPVIVHLLQPKASATFHKYATQVFLPYLANQLQNSNRGDVVWDVYLPDSLKQFTHTKRGKGKRQRVTGKAKVPRNWEDFLRQSENKEELFSYLTEMILKNPPAGKEIYVTDGKNVLCTTADADLDYLQPCTHEEADSRMILHAFDAASKMSQKILIRTVDTDVVVLAIANAQKLGIAELWVAFNKANKFRYLAIHEIAAALGPRKSAALTVFHAFTGCDTVSSFRGRGKKTAWNIWNVFDEVTEAFILLANNPQTIPPHCQVLLERFVVLLYDRTSNITEVNEARVEFVTQGRALDNITPTQAALYQHSLRAVHQAGHEWGTVHEASPTIPSHTNWGWHRDDNNMWKPLWTTLPEASKACRELIKCNCKKKCSRCRCVRENLKCTTLCKCPCKKAK